MGLFSWLQRFQSEPEPDREWWTRVRQLEARQHALELEWEDTFEKVRSQLAKLGKRAAKLAEASDSPEEPSTAARVGRMPTSDYAARFAAAKARYSNGRTG